MELVTFAVLAMFTIFAYRYGKCNLLSPWFLLCLSFLATYCLVLLNFRNWEVQINVRFLLYISTAIMAFGIGSGLVNGFAKPAPRFKEARFSSVDQPRSKKKYPANLFLLVSLVLSIVYTVKLVVDVGEGSSFSEILRSIYTQQVNGYTPGFLFSQMRTIVMAIAYLNTYRLWSRIYTANDKISILKLLLPIVFFVLLILVTTDRNALLQFAIYAGCIWVFVFGRRYKGRKLNKKIAVRAICMVAAVAVVFFLFGKAKQYNSDFMKSVSIYGGSGLYNLNLWLQEGNRDLMWGQSTFTTFMGSLGTLLKLFGIHLQGAVDQIDPFIEFTASNGYVYSSNIYTALKPYIEDFGYFGVVLFPCILGILYQWLFLKAKRSESPYFAILYSMLIYAVIYFPILERFFRRFHFGLVYELFWIFVLFFSVYGFKRKKRRSAEEGASNDG